MSVQLSSLQSAPLVRWISKPECHRGQAESRKSEMAAWSGQLFMAQRQLVEVIKKIA
jgi:hypothetical protein